MSEALAGRRRVPVTAEPRALAVTWQRLPLQSTAKESAAEEKLSPVVLAKQVVALKQQLVSTHLEKLLGPDAAINLTDPDGALAK